jgi:hypothetical protein
MIRIKINGLYINTGEQEFAVTRSVIDFKNIGDRQGDYSTSYSVPNDDTNNPIFGYLIKLGFSSTPFQKIPAQIEDDGLVLSKGFIKVNSITESEINFNFFGGNSDWFEDLKGSKINEVDTRELDHTYTGANITNSFANEWSDGYIYPIIDYGLFTDRGTTTIAAGEILPAMFCKWLFLKLFNEIGWRVKGDLLNDVKFNRMILPTVNKLDRKREWVQARTVRAYQDATQTIAVGTEAVLELSLITKTNYNPYPFDGYFNEDGINITAGLYDISSYRFTADEAMTVQVSGWMSFFTFGGTFTTQIGYKINGGSYVNIKTIPNGQATPYITSVNLVAGDYIEMVGKHTAGADPIGILFNRGTWVQFTPSANISINQTIYMKDALPTLDKAEFVKDILIRFCCLCTTDNEKKEVTFTPFDSIKNNGVEDWSDKLDLTEGYEVDYEEQVNGYGKNNYFKNTEDDKDLYLVNYNAANDLDFGDGNLKINNDWLSSDEDIYESPFAATTIVNAFNSELYLPHITRYSDTALGVTESDIEPEPRILIISPEIDINNFGSLASLTILGVSVTSINLAYYARPILSGDFDAFNHTISFGSAFGYTDESVLTNYYSFVTRILNKPSLLKCQLRLTPKDWANLQMLTPKYLSKFEGRFLINKIDQYKFNSESTDVELIKL